MPDHSMFISSKVAARLSACLTALMLLLLTALPLQAHHLPPGMEDVDEFEDSAAFMAGLRHPLLGMDHWMFAFLVGVVAVAATQRKTTAGLIMALVMGGVLGGILGLNDKVLPGGQYTLPLMMLASLILLSGKTKISAGWQVAIIGGLALLQGNAHGLAWPLEEAADAYLAGMSLMTLLLALAGSAVVCAARVSLAKRRSSMMVSL